MRLSDIRLKNFRCFENLQIRFANNITVLVANNGNGKTSILDAIAIAFGPFLTRLPKVKGKDFGGNDLRIQDDGKPAPFQAIAARIFIGEKKIEWTRFAKRDQSKWTEDETEKEIQSEQAQIKADGNYDLRLSRNAVGELYKFADGFIEASHTETPYSLPILAYYGTGRGVFSVPERRTGFQKDFGRFDAYNGCLDPKTNFRKFFEYFYFLEDFEKRQIVDAKNFDFRNPELEVIRRAITTFLKEFSNPRTELRPLRFLLDQKMGDAVRTFDVRTLSDGYRTSLGVVMDLASRMAEANPHMGVEALESAGVVLIDEIDMHLHPEWQQHIIQDLQRTFPNLQFICTTHSPQVLSTIPKESILFIDENHQARSPDEQTRGVPSNEVLSRVMNVDPTPNVKEASLVSCYKELIQSGEAQSGEGVKLWESLADHFGEGHPELLECQRLARLEAFKKRISNGEAK